MGGPGYAEYKAAGSPGNYLHWEYKRKIAAEDEKLKPTAAMQTPSLSDKAIQDAILAERNRSLAGQSRTAAFAVRDQRKMYTGA